MKLRRAYTGLSALIARAKRDADAVETEPQAVAVAFRLRDVDNLDRKRDAVERSIAYRGADARVSETPDVRAKWNGTRPKFNRNGQRIIRQPWFTKRGADVDALEEAGLTARAEYNLPRAWLRPMADALFDTFADVRTRSDFRAVVLEPETVDLINALIERIEKYNRIADGHPSSAYPSIDLSGLTREIQPEPLETDAETVDGLTGRNARGTLTETDARTFGLTIRDSSNPASIGIHERTDLRGTAFLIAERLLNRASAGLTVAKREQIARDVRILREYAGGFSQAAVAKRLCLHRSLVERRLQKYGIIGAERVAS